MRNVNMVIEAGAGTGKTTRLVKVIMEALFVRTLPLDQIVALTFTKKAAGELKERVSLALHEVMDAARVDDLKVKPWWPNPATGLEDLKALAGQALSVIDRAEISTIHSFAFSLIKRFPLAAGIDPSAEIDDKNLRFDTLFRRDWPRWLSTELAEGSPREKEWLELLSQITLSEVQEAARHLADFRLPLEKLPISDADLPKRLAAFHEETRSLIQAHGTDLNAGKVAAACEEIFGISAAQAWEKLSEIPLETSGNLGLSVGDPKAWGSDIERLETLQRAAKNILARGDRLIALMTELLKPFITAFRTTLLSEGGLTHSALLYLSRDLVKNHPAIREVLKRDIRLILIDEFQDTDPLQAEVIVFLAEKTGLSAKDWKKVQLEEGKLYIVGDPKQSIYRFRGADIAVYEEVCGMILAQGGDTDPLSVNYRSQAQILHWVNQAFEQIIQPIPRVSPPYAAVTPHHPHDPTSPLHDVEIWVAGSEEKQSVEEAQATEAEAIALWIAEHTRQHTVARRDIALIFRTYSPMDRYIDALRRHDIPFVVESERYFYTTPEVTDMINLLHAADDPADNLSLIGFLRSPLAGLTDEDILRCRLAGTLESHEMVREVHDLGRRLLRESLSDVLRHLFEDTFLIELYARSYHGDQTIANLEKLRRLLEGFAAEGVTTMGLLLKKLQEFFEDDTLEGENPLADENYDAVKLMTIHKAKGLEFPVVFLPSLHSALSTRNSELFKYDWRTGTAGLATGKSFCNLDKILLDEETRAREAAELNRLLYVAMTRPKQRLILSGGINLKVNKSGTFLRRLSDAWKIPIADAAEGKLTLGSFTLTIKHLPKSDATRENPRTGDIMLSAPVDPQMFAKVWKEREAKHDVAEKTPLVLTPTQGPRDFETSRKSDARSLVVSKSRSQFTMLGTLLHLFLETWDFTCEKCSMPAKLRVVANSYFASEGLLKEPFPDPKDGEKSNNPPELIEIVEEAQRLLADFIGSEAWQEIKDSQILGREIPFFYRAPEGALMRGTIDILYRLPSNKLVIGDYKTGTTIQDYSAQALAYQNAVKLALGEEATFKIISLREEAAIS